MSTAVASAPAIGVRNGNLMHGQRLSHARRVAVGARHGRAAPRTMAFVPNLIPNPFHRWGDDANPNAPPETTLRGMLAAKHDKWQVGHENGYDESDTVWRKFRCRNKAKGHELLEAVQDELYVPNEQGCRIRRESQGMFYMCCDGVRVRLNETKSEVLVEVPLPRETNAEIAACEKTLRVVEDLAKKSGCKV